MKALKRAALLLLAGFLATCAGRETRPGPLSGPALLVRKHRSLGSRMAFRGAYGDIYRAAARYFDKSPYYTVSRDWRAIYADDFHGMYSVGVFLTPTEWDDQTIVEVLYLQESLAFMESGKRQELEQGMLQGISASLSEIRGLASGPGAAAPTGETYDSRRMTIKAMTTSEVDAFDGSAPRRPQDLALIVGVERYALLGEADYASRDAAIFRKYAEKRLGVPAANAILLVDKDAARADILGGLERLRRSAARDSRVWVYFAGHGASDAETGIPYLLPWDADPRHWRTTALPLADVYKSLTEIDAAQVIAVLDTSFAGFGDRTWSEENQRPLVAARMPDAPASPRMTVILAASPGETARSIEDQGHGVLTYYFLRGLRGEAAPRADLTLQGLFDYASKMTRAHATRLGGVQTPRLLTHSVDVPLP